MLLRERDAFWRQCNGIQATAFFHALWLYLKQHFDATIDYFDKFSIETVNTQHLDTIGAIIGATRPTVYNPDFWADLLKYQAQYNQENLGFDSIYQQATTGSGGIFGYDADDPNSESARLPITDDEYRDLLRIVAKYRNKGGLTIVDEILDKWLTPLSITWTYIFDDAATGAPFAGDIYVRLSQPNDYAYLLCQAIIDQLFTTAPKITLVLP